MNAEKLTSLQGAIISAYTGVLCCRFSDLHAYVEQILNRPVFIHEMADEKVSDQVKKAAREDFLRIRAE